MESKSFPPEPDARAESHDNWKMAFWLGLMERTSTMKQNQPAACLLPPPSQTTGHGFAETTKRITSPPPVFVLGQHPEGSTHLPGTMLPCQVLQAVLQAAPGDKTAPCHQQTTHGGVEQRCRSSDLIPGRAASSLLLQITPLSTASIFSRGTLIRKFKKKILNAEKAPCSYFYIWCAAFPALPD